MNINIVSELNSIFINECSYKKINEISQVQMRYHKDGIQLTDVLLYKILYSEKDMTKERAASIINNRNELTFTRQAYEGKENNIPIKIYENIYSKISGFYTCNFTNINSYRLMAVDGTYNNDIDMNDALNMGFYDITNGIVLDISPYGNENKNKEVSSTIDYIKNHIDQFKNIILVGDRAYFTYEFMLFLIKNNIEFIIRCKGDGKNLLPNTHITPSLNNYDTIMKLRDEVRVINYENTIKKTVKIADKKKKIKTFVTEINNDCVICTNILDDEEFSDQKILDMYRSRWDIEVFFKILKNNYKFQHIHENSDEGVKK